MKWSATVHVNDLGFPEGPVALPDGSIAFVDLLHAKVRAHRDGETRVIADLPGAPNGMRLGPDGSLYVANNGGLAPLSLEALSVSENSVSGRLQKLGLDGTVTDFATELPGRKPSRPNDLVFTLEGEIVFTDPQNWETLGSDPDAYYGGQLLIAARDGTVRHLADMTGFPNGIAFHPDGSLLVNSTVERRILRFPWLGGTVGPMEEWCRFDDRVAPDGMVFHEDRLYVTGSSLDHIAVVSTSGDILDVVHTGEGSDPTNCCVHRGRLWVTLGIPGQLVSSPL